MWGRILGGGILFFGGMVAGLAGPERGKDVVSSSDRALIRQIENHLLDLKRRDEEGAAGLSCQEATVPGIEGLALGQQVMVQMSCQDLLSSSPPAWVGLGEGELATDWSPICWARQYKMLQRKNPQLSSAALLAKTEAALISLDYCAEAPKRMRGAEGYVAPTQRSLGARPLKRGVPEDDEVRASVVKRYETARESAAQSCCSPQEGDCLAAMRKMPLVWCEPQQNPDVPDRCLSLGTTFNLTEAAQASTRELRDKLETLARKNSWAARDWKSRAAATKGIPVLLEGRVELPALRWKEGISVSPLALHHELAHACSYVRSSLGMARGDVADFYVNAKWAYKEACGNEKGEREPDFFRKKAFPLLEERYSRLLARTGASEATQRCFARMVESAEKLRFLPTEDCTQSCPAQWYEELWAEWESMLTLPDSELFPAVVPAVACATTRDKTHPLGPEVLDCALQTPAFRARVERLVGCQKAGSGG